MNPIPETKWIEPDHSKPLPADLLEGVGGNELLARALVNRGISSWQQAEGFLDYFKYSPADPFDLPDMDIAVQRLQNAIRDQECIGVWGDFDVDGQTATSLLVGVLRGLDANVVFHVPIRAKESHGVNLAGLVKFVENGVDLVVTCDTGITAHQAADFAREQGFDLIITDHHSLAETLPDALAVVNPQRLAPGHPLRTLAGVGVAFQLAKALCSLEGKPGLADQQLDLVALGCVADVAGLTGDVRYLVQLGLEQLRNPQRIGLKAMYERAELNPERMTEQHIGFILGPRLNAIGRLSDANPVVDFLTSADTAAAAVFAARLEGLNSERRFMTEQVFQGALTLLEREPALTAAPLLILNHPDWPAGVIGIVASRLVELFNKPVILLSSPPGEPARGSARSIEGVNITQAIAAGSDLLIGFGGHPMAAGLAIEPINLPQFRQRAAQSVRQQTAGLDLTPQVVIDAVLRFDDLTLEAVTELERLAPFGAGNPPIILAARNVRAVDVTAIGKTGEHLQVMVEDEAGSLRRVLWWQGIRDLIPEGQFDLAFTARTSDFRGALDVQLEWVNARVIEPSETDKKTAVPGWQTLDFRDSLDPLKDLAALSAGSDCVIWREGSANGDPKGLQRAYLVPGQTLVIWNPPPGGTELRQALDQVQPTVVALFANTAGNDEPQAFLAHLSGLVRHALRTRAGEISVTQFAGLLNQREHTVRLGINWLIAKGFLRQMEYADNNFVLAEPGVPNPQAAAALERDIQVSLDETAAYRSFYRRADPDGLLSVS
ncbi:MAG TPA: single-stranded-DNA-specific exonuclease RecJ [Bellilinea sp.]|nr:single-stranded-DNA-specific exonuclease RecJ [Bellilinea sp.]